MNYIFKNLNNEEKLDDILNKYKEVVFKTNQTTKMMMLVPNRNIKLLYHKNIDLEITNNLNIYTYNSFIQKELVKYWPIVCKNCPYIKEKNIKPYFMSNGLSEYLILDKVNQKRESDNYFDDLTASNYSIANSILFNINKACQSNFYLGDIGNKVYSSKKNNDRIMRFSYSQMDEIIEQYITKTLEKGIIDYSISIFLYNEYLLKDNLYNKILKNDMEYLIVDSLENSTISEINLINELLEEVKEGYLYLNLTKDYANFNNVDISYIKQILYPKCDIISKNNMDCVTLDMITKQYKKINLNDSYQLHSEMLEGIIKDILGFIDKGVKPEDIAIISPINDITLDYELQVILNGYSIDIHNTKKDKRIIDYPYAHSLMVAIAIYADIEFILSHEDYVNFYSLIFNMNKIKANNLVKNQKYKDLKEELIDYIKSNRYKELSIPQFLRKFYLDKLINLKEGKENIHICKKMIEESERFLDSIEFLRLDFIDKKEVILVECLKKNIKDYYSINELDEVKNENTIILTTPYTYISSNMKHYIQIWVDIGSNTWNMKNEKELSNIHVFKHSFKDNRVYTDDMEERYKRYYLYNTVYNLLENCNEVYAYKSEYTVNGYIQESMLYTLLLKLRYKGDNYELNKL